MNDNTNDIQDPYTKYKRKSEEDKSKQVASIASQERTFRETIPFVNDYEPIADFEEEQSAKAPGRPKFNEMCDLLEKGLAKKNLLLAIKSFGQKSCRWRQDNLACAKFWCTDYYSNNDIRNK